VELKVDISGDKELVKKLLQLEATVARMAIREALKAGAEVIAEEARQNAPVETGNLRENIGLEKESVTKTGGSYKIGPSKKAFYGLFVEMGHPIVVGGRRTAKKKPGRVVGFVPPKPFLRPAFDSRKAEAEKVVRDKLKQLIEQAVK